MKSGPREDLKAHTGQAGSDGSRKPLHWDLPITQQEEQAGLLLQAIIDSSDDAIISKDLNGIVTSWNCAAESMFGYSKEEILGQPILRIIPPELHKDEHMILASIRSGRHIDHFQTVRMRKDGSRIDISLSVSPIRDQHGKVVGAAKIARDITQQKGYQEAAHRLAAIVESSDDAIISKDLNGIVTSWNMAAELMLGYTAAEAVGKPITFIIPNDLHHEEPVILEKIRSGKRIDHFETVRLHKSGRLLDVSLTISPVRHERRVVGAAKILRDVSKQKSLETALRTSEKLASVGRLAATIAHEINNPLEAIMNLVYLARQSPDLPENVKAYLELADHELSRVAHVAQQTLAFYRDNTRPMHVVISKLVDDVLYFYGKKLKNKEITVEKRIPSQLMFFTFQGELKQVLLNLVGNAIDALGQNGRLIIAGRLMPQFRLHRNTLVLTVADTGPGIPTSNQSKIFEPFFTTKKDVGTGLGLWIVKDLLEKKGGHIRVRTRTGDCSGTAMSIFLPEEDQLPKESAAF